MLLLSYPHLIMNESCDHVSAGSQTHAEWEIGDLYPERDAGGFS
jgi:hypothetical protein